MTELDYATAVNQGNNVALALAVKRFRDEYGWTEEQVKSVSSELLKKMQKRLSGEIETISKDLSRMEGLGQPREQMHCLIVASMALIGAQVCESFEMSRRAEAN
jgi:hypothetical protein